MQGYRLQIALINICIFVWINWEYRSYQYILTEADCYITLWCITLKFCFITEVRADSKFKYMFKVTTVFLSMHALFSMK